MEILSVPIPSYFRMLLPKPHPLYRLSNALLLSKKSKKPKLPEAFWET